MVDRVLDLQRRRSFARSRLNSIDDRIEDWPRQQGPAGSWEAGRLLLQDRVAAVDRIDALTAEIAQALIDLSDCNLKCVRAPGGTALVTPSTGGTPAQNGPPQTTCRDCDEAARRLADAAARKRLAEEELRDYERSTQQDEQQQTGQQESRQKALRELRANGQGASDEAFQLEIEIRSHEHEQAVREQSLGDDPYPEEVQQRLSASEKEVLGLQQKLEDCQKSCKPKETSQLFRGPLPYVLGGAVVGGMLIANGGDTPTTAAATPPISAPAPTPPITSQPAPPPTVAPAPAPPPTIAGVADCTRCEVLDDSGRQNVAINLCPQLTGGFEIAVASITIRHPAPFVDLVGAQYDQASGVFRGTTRGTVAGIPNVGITVDGTANAGTGEIRFIYTMGTGGELPGGRPITYAITLQKRR